MAGSVAKIYGSALLETCTGEADLLKTVDEAEALLPYFGENAPFGAYLQDPAAAKADKEDAIREIFGGQISERMTGLFAVVLEKNREREIAEILEYFIDAAKEKLGIGTAYISLPFEAPASQKAAIEKKLLETSPYRKLEYVYTLDPELIGGIVVKIGDRVVDGSVKNRLNMLERELNRVVLD